MVDNKYNPSLLPYAKQLRKNMTKEERHLWYEFLRDYPVRFLRQKILGKYIVDFYCPKAGLIIELDGSQHFEKNGMSYDEERTNYLKNYNLQVIRIPNCDVTSNFRGVCEYIDHAVKEAMGE